LIPNQIFINVLDINSVNHAPYIDTWDDSTDTVKGFIEISSKTNIDNSHIIFQLNSITSETGYRKLNVTNIGGGSLTLDPGDAGVIRFTRTGNTGSQGSTGPTGPTGATGPQGTGVSWTDISSNITASPNTGYFCDTSGGSFILTLPTSSPNGTIVGINDITGTFDTNPLTIHRNGALIQGIAEDLLADLKNASFLLIYNNDNNTWNLDTYLSQGFGDEILIPGATGATGPPGVTGATAATGAVIDFTVSKIFNSPGSPATVNITNNLTGAVIGIVQKIYHQNSIAPTFPSEWISIKGSYVVNELNIIYAEWVSGERVEYWLTQEQ
jgi:hypothetical protein